MGGGEMKAKSILFFVGALLMALGGFSLVIGIVYSGPESIDALDPMIAMTEDAWLLFLEAHSHILATSGLGAMFIGAGLAWFGELIPKKNRIVPGWEKRAC